MTAIAHADSAARPADELALEALFREVHSTRMADLALSNPRLRVEALGFRDWRGARVGALVTPWSIVLAILPGGPAATADGSAGPVHGVPADAAAGAPRGESPASSVVRRLPAGATQLWSFPAGEFAFHGHESPGLGHYQQCSLFSPALAFDSHESARIAALAALDALFASPEPPAAPTPRRVTRRGLLGGAAP